VTSWPSSQSKSNAPVLDWRNVTGAALQWATATTPPLTLNIKPLAAQTDIATTLHALGELLAKLAGDDQNKANRAIEDAKDRGR